MTGKPNTRPLVGCFGWWKAEAEPGNNWHDAMNSTDRLRVLAPIEATLSRMLQTVLWTVMEIAVLSCLNGRHALTSISHIDAAEITFAMDVKNLENGIFGCR